MGMVVVESNLGHPRAEVPRRVDAITRHDAALALNRVHIALRMSSFLEPMYVKVPISGLFLGHLQRHNWGKHWMYYKCGRGMM